MKNIKNIMLAGAVALGVTAIANTEASADTYTVKQGDTVWDLAQANGVSVSDIDALNPALDINTHLIVVGQTIELPGGVSVTLPEATPAPVAPVAQAPVATEAVSDNISMQTSNQDTKVPATNEQYQAISSSAKDIIAGRESGGSYGARNGQYVGKYQLTDSYLNGDYSPENQERVADAYVANRYGSWDNALAFWNANGWY